MPKNCIYSLHKNCNALTTKLTTTKKKQNPKHFRNRSDYVIWEYCELVMLLRCLKEYAVYSCSILQYGPSRWVLQIFLICH